MRSALWLLVFLITGPPSLFAQGYSTTPDPDPPKYTRRAPETGIDFLKNAAWLDIGLDYRFRHEYRAQAGLRWAVKVN